MSATAAFCGVLSILNHYEGPMRKPRIKNRAPQAPLNANDLDIPQLVTALERVGHHVSHIEVAANPAPFANGLARSVISAKAFMKSVADASTALTVMSAKAALVDRMFAVARALEPELTLDAFLAEGLKNIEEAEADQAATAANDDKAPAAEPTEQPAAA